MRLTGEDKMLFQLSGLVFVMMVVASLAMAWASFRVKPGRYDTFVEAFCWEFFPLGLVSLIVLVPPLSLRLRNAIRRK